MKKAKKSKTSLTDSVSYTSDLMKIVAGLKELCDVTLVAGIDKQKFPAHRLILIASSKYFAALLGPNFREAAQEEVILKDMKGPMLKIILNYIYTGRIEITAGNVVGIIAAASSMELIALEQRCGKILLEANLSIENCVEMFLNADRFHLNGLRSKALTFICSHFDAVPIEDIQQIDGKNFQEVLKNDRITAAETVIFDALVQWINENGSRAVDIAPDLLKLIRLDHIPTEFLIETMEPVFEQHECGKMVMSEYRKRLLKPKTICLHRFTTKAIYCSASNASKTGINIQKYDSAKNEWNEFKSIAFSDVRSNFGSVVFDGELFVMGGETIFPLYDVESYNLENFTKTTLLPMKSSRSEFTPICVGKYIYVFGGYRFCAATAECERFDTKKRKWQQRKAMPRASHKHAAVEFNGMIYVADKNDFFCYNPESDLWSEKRSCITSNDTPSLAKSKEHIYAIESNCIVHQYDANEDRWTPLEWFANFGTILGSIYYCNQIYILCSNGKSRVLILGDQCTFIQLNPISMESGGAYMLFSN